jgi:PIN domain nuclease of toxin-antitoxin system
MNNGPLVVDTHVLLWSLLEPEELNEEVKKCIDSVQENNRLLA